MRSYYPAIMDEVRMKYGTMVPEDGYKTNVQPLESVRVKKAKNVPQSYSEFDDYYEDHSHQEDPIFESESSFSDSESWNPTYKRFEEWETLTGQFFKDYLNAKTVAGKTCSLCDNPASVLCQTCVLSRPFCFSHAKIHSESLQHQMINKDGTYLGADGPGEGERDTGIVLISCNGWRYTELSAQSVAQSGIWFPMTPTRPTVYVKFDAMEMAKELMTTAMLSVELIMNYMEKCMSVPPPAKWRQFFGEALRRFSILTTLVKRGATVDEMILRSTDQSKISCIACFSKRMHVKGTVIHVR